MNTSQLPKKEERGERAAGAEPASRMGGLHRSFRFAAAAEHLCPEPGYYLMLLRQYHAKDRRDPTRRVFATEA